MSYQRLRLSYPNDCVKAKKVWTMSAYSLTHELTKRVVPLLSEPTYYTYRIISSSPNVSNASPTSFPSTQSLSYPRPHPFLAKHKKICNQERTAMDSCPGTKDVQKSIVAQIFHVLCDFNHFVQQNVMLSRSCFARFAKSFLLVAYHARARATYFVNKKSVHRLAGF